MQPRDLETLILEQLGRQNTLSFDRVLPRLESYEERINRLEAAVTDLITQNLDDLKAKRNPEQLAPEVPTKPDADVCAD